LGGTAWLGRAVADAAMRAGHEVTCVARGAAVPAGASLLRADRDRDDALAAAAAAPWDAVVDVAQQPGHVRRAVRDLEPVAERFVFVSSISVYASQAETGADEDAATLDPLDADAMGSLEDYGAAKAACEQAVLGGFGAARAAIVRAGLIGGPGDPSGRTGYWPLRFARPSSPEGAVLVPDAPELPTALIDVRDLANWIARLAQGGAAGVFNAAGDPRPFPEHIAAARVVAGHTGPLALAPEAWLTDQRVAQWSGPRSLPLWLADRALYGLGARSNALARAAGLELRPLADTLADSLAWDLNHPAAAPRGAGLGDADERELLALLGQARMSGTIANARTRNG
jgi:nucleoside-diphosphate-sugar epimerase